MPIYEYRCGLCSHELEQIQKISDPPLTQCPQCNKAGLEKLISNTSFRLTGDGWYVTDFKDKKPESTPKKPAKTDQSSSESTPAKSSNDKATSSTQTSSQDK